MNGDTSGPRATAAHRAIEPVLWLAFSAGGTLAAFLIPGLLFVLAFAYPLGWLTPPDHERMLELLHHPLARLAIVLFCGLALAHWAYRFRSLATDALRARRVRPVIGAFCYVCAAVGTAAAVYLLLQLP